MKRIWFSGGEVPSHRRTLGKYGARNLAFNLEPVVTHRSKHAGAKEELEAYNVLFYSSQADTDPDTMVEIINEYQDEDSLVLGIEGSTVQPIPIWNGQDTENFIDDAVLFGHVAITEADANNVNNQRVLSLFIRRNPSVRVFCITSKAAIIGLPFITDPIVSGWIHASQYGELQIWDGSKVARSPRASRADRIEQHRGQIENLGCDPQLLLDGVPEENIKLSVTSWLKYEEVVANDLVVNLPSVRDPDEASLTIRSTEVRHRDPVLLPTLVTQDRTDDDGSTHTEIVPGSQSMRQCDACNLAHVCPMFEAGASCAYSIPVRIRTKRELNHVLNTLLEMQTRRAMMGMFEEEVLSEGILGTTSAEMERLFRMAETVKRINEDRQTLTITAEGSGPGPLSELFGSRVGDLNNELPAPVDSDTVIEDADVLDR
jgi:hypothetical protein